MPRPKTLTADVTAIERSEGLGCNSVECSPKRDAGQKIAALECPNQSIGASAVPLNACVRRVFEKQLLRQRPNRELLRHPQVRALRSRNVDSVENLDDAIKDYIDYYNHGRVKLEGLSPVLA